MNEMDNEELRKFREWQETHKVAQEFSEAQLADASSRSKENAAPHKAPGPEFAPDIPGITRKEVPRQTEFQGTKMSLEELNASLEKGLEHVLLGKEEGSPDAWVEQIANLQETEDKLKNHKNTA